MKGKPEVLNSLNQILSIELGSINQYFLHARMHKNWGFNALNEKAYKKSIKDMKQADQLIERILFLEGLPNLQHLEKLHIGEHCAEMLSCDKHLQLEQITALRTAITVCEEQQDYISRELLEELLQYEEDYLDWIETQECLIQSTGIENYLQANIDSE
jgi:bacterioferritin